MPCHVCVPRVRSNQSIWIMLTLQQIGRLPQYKFHLTGTVTCKLQQPLAQKILDACNGILVALFIFALYSTLLIALQPHY